MSDLLSQDEIDSLVAQLFAEMSGGGAETDTKADAEAEAEEDKPDEQ